MDSHGRQKAIRKVLELTKDPEVANIARGVLCGADNARARDEPKPRLSAKEWVPLLLAIVVAIIIF